VSTVEERVPTPHITSRRTNQSNSKLGLRFRDGRAKETEGERGLRLGFSLGVVSLACGGLIVASAGEREESRTKSFNEGKGGVGVLVWRSAGRTELALILVLRRMFGLILRKTAGGRWGKKKRYKKGGYKASKSVNEFSGRKEPGREMRAREVATALYDSCSKFCTTRPEKEKKAEKGGKKMGQGPTDEMPGERGKKTVVLVGGEGISSYFSSQHKPWQPSGRDEKAGKQFERGEARPSKARKKARDGGGRAQ